MKKQTSVSAILPVLFGFFVMGFCDIVGISSDYAREAFGWSHTMAGFVPLYGVHMVPLPERAGGHQDELLGA